MDAQDYLRAFRRNILLIVSTTIIGVCIGLVAALVTPARYVSSTELYVSVQSSKTGSFELNQARNYAQQSVSSYATLMTSEIVLRPVIDDLGLDQTVPTLADRVTATVPTNGVSITLSVSASSPSHAARLANAIADSFRTVISEEIEGREGGQPSPIRIDVLQPAQVPLTPAAPNLPLWTLLGGLIGLGAGIAISVLRLTLDTRIHGLRDLALATDKPNLGLLPFESTAPGEPLPVSTSPRSPFSEAVRSLRTNVRFLHQEGSPMVITVTSAGPGEGKTTVSSNLAIALAETGARVALIDGDLRLPRVAERFGIEADVGLSDVLAGRLTAADAIQRWGRGTLFLLPAGIRPPNPAELLGSTAMRRLLEEFSRAFDVVIIDAPPVLLVTDAAILADRSTGALMVVSANKATGPRLSAAIESVEKIGARVLGTILTMVPMKGTDKSAYAAEGAEAVASIH